MPINNQRGVALLTVIIFSAVLLVVGSLLAYKVMTSTRTSGEQGVKTATYYTANAGVERARNDLMVDYPTNNWTTYLTEATAGVYPAAAGLNEAVGGQNVTVFVRDNNDEPAGLENYLQDNDLKVFVLAQGVGPNGTQTMVEALVFLDISSGGGGYSSQLGDGAARTGRSLSSLADPAAAAVSTSALK